MNSWRTMWVVLALLAASATWVGAGRYGELAAVDIRTARMALSGDGMHPPGPEAAAWRPLDLRVLAGWSGPFWVRLDLRLTASGSPAASAQSPLALRLSMRAASEAYWDGQLLGRNGRVGRSADDEVPGRIDWTVPVPPALAMPGDHRLLLRTSSFHQGFEPYMAELHVQLGPTDVLYGRAYARWLVAAIAFGAVAVAGLYFASHHRRRLRADRSAGRLLILLGLVGLLLPLVEGWRVLPGYNYDLHPLRLYLLLGLDACAAALLPAYLQVRFEGRTPYRVIAGFALLMLAIVLVVPSFDGRSLLLHLSGLLASLLILWRARNRGDDDRFPVMALLLATLAMLLTSANAFLDGLYFIALAVLMTFLLLQHAAQLAGLDKQVAELQAQRARLTTQLLQRSIHPHWLMNTLTSLQELIEQAPTHASRMVELLADEFSRMRAIGERPLIPIAEEIALCRTHLEIIGTAHGCRIPFDVEVFDVGPSDAGPPAVHNDIDAVQLPPGVLHALVENALTHAGAAACAMAGFRLQVRRHGAQVTLELRAALGRGAGDAPVERTGTRFVRASLAAAYPAGASSFEHGRDDGRWHSRIVLPCAS